MLRVFCDAGAEFVTVSQAGPLPLGHWIDMLSPTVAESALLLAQTGLSVASRDELAEIESSSRLQERDGVLYLSLPLVVEAAQHISSRSQIGMILSEQRLVTVRFGDVPGLATFEANLRTLPPQAPAALLVGLLEALVEHTADQLERVRDAMDATANSIFLEHSGAAGPSRDNRELRQALQKVSQTGDFISRLHDTLLVMGRIVSYVGTIGPAWFPHELKPRMKILRQDITSLKEFDSHVSEKVHFLLDAILGFVNIAQNHIIKVLAVVGTVGVPPTLIASIYGMNFAAMPELHLAWGYPAALLLIVVSAVIPLMWFRSKGWL